MPFIVFTVILFVLAFCLFFGGKFAKTENPDGLGSVVAYGGPVAIGVLWVIFVAWQSFVTIDPGHIGIVKQFGSYTGTMHNGTGTKPPWASVKVVSVQDTVRTYQMDDQPDSAGSAVSSDSQPVYLVVQVRYQLQEDKAVALYVKTGGDFVNRILDPAVFQNVKEVTAQYKAVEFAKNREEIRDKIERSLNTAVASDALVIKNVTIKNVAFTKALNEAIEQTVEAEQNAKREEAKVKIVIATANQAVEEAKGQKRSAIEAATGEATANIIKAKAEARANKLRAASLSPQVLQQQAIDKLNPGVQVIYCPPKSVCIPNGTTTTPVPAP